LSRLDGWAAFQARALKFLHELRSSRSNEAQQDRQFLLEHLDPSLIPFELEAPESDELWNRLVKFLERHEPLDAQVNLISRKLATVTSERLINWILSHSWTHDLPVVTESDSELSPLKIFFRRLVKTLGPENVKKLTALARNLGPYPQG